MAESPPRSSVGSIVLPVLRRLIGAIGAAFVGTLLVGALSGWLSFHSDRSGAAIRSAALFAPLAVPVALFLAPIAAIFSSARTRRILEWSVANPARARTIASWLFVVPASMIIWIAVTARVGRVFRTAFHHVGLATLAQACALAAVSAVIWLFALLARIAIESRIPDRLVQTRLLPYAFAIGLLLGFTLLLVGVATGDEHGVGGFLGTYGVLKRKELDLGPVYGLLGAFGAAALLSLVASRWWIVGSVFLAGGLSGTALGIKYIAVHFSDSVASVEIDAQPNLARMMLHMLRNRADRDHDHYATLYGGGDCDDTNAAVNPEAQEIAGNGIDEDCSGRDAPKPPPPPLPPPPRVQARVERAVPKEVKFNLVVITVDTLRWDLHYAGNQFPLSPQLDKLAARSVVFDKAYALSSFTGRAIGPLFTGRYPTECPREWGHFVQYPSDNVFLAERLTAAGFKTFGVASHFYFERHSGLAQGMSEWDMSPRPDGDEQESTSHDADVADHALKMLGDGAHTAGRFMMWLHFFDPHKQYVRHPELPELGSGEHGKYNGEVAWTDRQIGRIVDAISASPAGNNTIIVVTADHGEAFGEHGLHYHGVELWEELVRVPLIVYVPGFAPRHVTEARSQIDLVPTLLQLLRVAPPATDAPDSLSGTSLVADMLGEVMPSRPIYLELPEGPFNSLRRSVIDGGWKLIERGSHGGLLYDLNTDPVEKVDMADTNKEQLERMKNVMEQVRAGLHSVPERGRH